MKKLFCVLPFGLTLVLLMGMFSFAVETPTYGQLLFDLGIISGANGDLNEGGEIKREEMVVILNRLSAEYKNFQNYVAPKQPSFIDVPLTHWAYRDIEFALSNGLTSGVGNGKFGLGHKINYNQASLFLIRSLGHDTSDVRYDAASASIMNNYGLGFMKHLDGEETLTRGAVFELLAKTLNMRAASSEVRKVEALAYPIEKIEAFTGNLYAAKQYAKPIVVDTSKWSKNDMTFRSSDVQTIDVSKLNEWDAKAYEDMKKINNEMNRVIRTYLNADAKYTKTTLEDFKSASTEKLYYYETVGIYQYEGEEALYFYKGGLDISFGDDNQLNFLISSSEGYTDSAAVIYEVRQYEPRNGLMPYVLLFSEYDQYKGYLTIIVNSNGDIVETIGDSEFGKGFYSY